jgi:hypothetical protein
MADNTRLSDADLIAKCLNQDAEAWEVLVRRYQRLIASITFKYGLSSEDAAPLAEEAETLFAGQRLKAKSCSARIIKARALLDGGGPARELCEEILRDCLELEAPWLRYQAHELLGDLFLAEGENQRAHEQYVEAVSFIEQIRCQIRVDEFRSAFFRDKLRVYEKLIRLCLDSVRLCGCI